MGVWVWLGAGGAGLGAILTSSFRIAYLLRGCLVWLFQFSTYLPTYLSVCLSV